MRPFAQVVRESATMWLLGGVLVLALQGCTTEVVVTCGPSGMKGTTNTGIGNCNPGMPWSGGSATGFWDDVLMRKIQASENKICGNGSTKCKATPGFCSGGNCVSHYSQGTCYCGCPP
jgi:hypothetical protein